MKFVDPVELQRVLCEQIGYSTDFVKEQRVSRLRRFAAHLLKVLRLDSWAALRDLDAVIRDAALRTTEFAPPGGALEFFEVLCDRACFVAC